MLVIIFYRVHELLADLRITLSARSGIESTLIDPNEPARPLEDNPVFASEEEEEERLRSALVAALPRAGQIVSILRMHPEYLLATMNSCTPGSLALAFIDADWISRKNLCPRQYLVFCN